MAVGAVTAGIIAKFEAERAERNFAAAKSTVDGLIFSIAQGLRNVEGIRVESLDKILDQARKTVERLTESDPDNPALLRSKAVMLDEFAKTYLAAGNLAAALKNAEESHAILSHLAETGGVGKDGIRNLSVSLIRLGDVKRAQGDRKAALQSMRRDSRNDRSGRKPTRRTRRAQRDVTVDLDRIADTKRDAGDRPAHWRPSRRALAIRRELAKANPNDEELQRAIEVSLGKVGDVKRDAGDAAGALAADHGGAGHRAAAARAGSGQYRVAARRRHRAREAGRPQAQRRGRGRRACRLRGRPGHPPQIAGAR